MKTRTDILPEIERQVFRVITDADWAREIRRARERKNEVRGRIQNFLAQKQLNREENEHGTHR